MPVLDQWKISIDANDVLRGQGADPEVILKRRPSLERTAEVALLNATSIIHPIILYEEYKITKVIHDRLELQPIFDFQKKPGLHSPLVTRQLGQAQEVIVMVCTIGSELDERVGSLFRVDPLAAIAMDGVGSAAIENLAIQACNYFEDMANSRGLNTSMPLNPGMIDWTVEQGQPEIFSLLDSEQIQVTLTDSCMMVPNKSISMILGVGKDVSATGTSCDFCNLKGICKYQNHYAE